MDDHPRYPRHQQGRSRLIHRLDLRSFTIRPETWAKLALFDVDNCGVLGIFALQHGFGRKRMAWLLRLFTWWQGATLNTLFHTWRRGEFVGEDEFGNRYYRTRGGAIDPALGFERRWVIYNGYAEGSATPPGWYGWLHHTSDVAPPDDNYKPRDWQLPFEPNLTGTPQAWRPPGSTLAAGTRPAATGDYEAWTP